MSSPKQNSFFDGRTIMAVVVGMGVMLAWQAHLKKKYPDAYKPSVTQAVSSHPTAAETTATQAQKQAQPETAVSGDPALAQPAAVGTEPEKTVHYEDENLSLEISSLGMSLKNVNLKKYNSREGGPIVFAAQEGTSLFSTGLIGRRAPLQFHLEQKTENEFVGRAEVEGVRLTKIIQFDKTNYSLKTTVKVDNVNDAFLGLATTAEDAVAQHDSGFSLIPQFKYQEFFILHDTKSTHERINPSKDLSESFPATKVMAFGDQYFTSAIVDKSEIIPEFKAEVISATQRSRGLLTHSLVKNNNQFSIQYIAFVGPKSLDVLSSIDKDLTSVINFGWFTSIGKIMKRLMTAIYGAINNWGIAIVLLTILIRVLVLPANMMSYKQMKAMQVIQPQMAVLRERYKSDPQKMNQEVMKLWKEAKANPLGGCLPMLLQIPIFFALYSVIGESIELYRAPFMLWLTDLSQPDRFFVLPILMGVVMFFQQKMTPSTMDPAQQKVLMFMPIIFTVMMVSLPSGLTLYMFVSALFGFLQQMYFLKGNKTQALKA